MEAWIITAHLPRRQPGAGADGDYSGWEDAHRQLCAAPVRAVPDADGAEIGRVMRGTVEEAAEKRSGREETADPSGLKPLGMTKVERVTARLKRLLKNSYYG